MSSSYDSDPDSNYCYCSECERDDFLGKQDYRKYYMRFINKFAKILDIMNDKTYKEYVTIINDFLEPRKNEIYFNPSKFRLCIHKTVKTKMCGYYRFGEDLERSISLDGRWKQYWKSSLKYHEITMRDNNIRCHRLCLVCVIENNLEQIDIKEPEEQ